MRRGFNIDKRTARSSVSAGRQMARRLDADGFGNEARKFRRQVRRLAAWTKDDEQRDAYLAKRIARGEN